MHMFSYACMCCLSAVKTSSKAALVVTEIEGQHVTHFLNNTHKALSECSTGNTRLTKLKRVDTKAELNTDRNGPQLHEGRVIRTVVCSQLKGNMYACPVNTI